MTQQIDLRMPEMETNNWYDLLYRAEDDEKFKTIRWQSVDEWTCKKTLTKSSTTKPLNKSLPFLKYYDNGIIVNYDIMCKMEL
jgi:hypothetical protein